jgi:hypothetical protein
MKSLSPLNFVTGITDLFLAKKGLPPIANISFEGINTFYKVASHLKEKSFNKKLEIFLKRTGETSDKDRLNFLESLDENKEEFWCRIILHLEKIDDEQKSEITGNLCKALIINDIKYDDFFRLVLKIENIYIEDLIYLNEHYNNKKQSTKPHNIHIKMSLSNDQLLNSGGSNPTLWGRMLIDYGFSS